MRLGPACSGCAQNVLRWPALLVGRTIGMSGRCGHGDGNSSVKVRRPKGWPAKSLGRNGRSRQGYTQRASILRRWLWILA